MRATITISTNADGGLDMLTHYDGGFNADDVAHQAALLLSAKMGELAEAQGPAREPTPEECAQIQGLAEPWAPTISETWDKAEDAMLTVDAENGVPQ